jgi:phage gpG-like protein
MIQIKIDDNEIKNKINQIKNNKKLIINKIASILEQDPYGQKWKPIKINTKRKNSSKVLIDTGTLRSSIKANVISENTIRLGVVGDLIYARVHQYKGFPQRYFILKSKNLLIKINFLSFPYTLQCQ